MDGSAVAAARADREMGKKSAKHSGKGRHLEAALFRAREQRQGAVAVGRGAGVGVGERGVRS